MRTAPLPSPALSWSRWLFLPPLPAPIILIPNLHTPSHPTPFSLRRLLNELRETLGNYSYLMLIFASLFTAAAAGFQDVMGIYVGTYFWNSLRVRLPC